MKEFRNPLYYIYFILTVGIAFPLLSMFLFRPLTGDLTRIGALPELLFAPNISQQSLYRINHRSSNSPPNYFIIGDSFTGEGLWQQFALPEDSSFTSYNFGQVCQDFTKYITSLKLSNSTVIVQLVERYFDERLFSTCTTSELFKAPQNSLQKLSYPSSPSLFKGLYGPRYIFGSLSYLLLRQPQYRSGDSGGVVIRSIPDGCLLFSHSDCVKSLFLGDDFAMANSFSSPNFSPFIHYIRHAGFSRIILVVIPNKSSVYLNDLQSNLAKDSLIDKFANTNNIENIPLFAEFYKSSRVIPDFYRPNDTHLSHSGYMTLGTIIYSYLTEPNSSL